MATFALTGIHRSRLKHYRPTYQSDLPPIYEDAVSSQHKPKYTIPANDDYIYVPSFVQSQNTFGQSEYNRGFVHDYEEIDACSPSQLNTCSRVTQVGNSMLHGIMSNRIEVQNKALESNKQRDCDSTDENGTNKPISTSVSSLRRSSTVYQGHSETSDGTDVVKTSKMFSNGSSAVKWPKLEPEALKIPHFLCPAEKKIKKRCFAVCFVVLILLIGTFVVVSLDGWVFTARGRGLGGTEKPILWKTFDSPIPDGNFTDIRHPPNLEET